MSVFGYVSFLELNILIVEPLQRVFPLLYRYEAALSLKKACLKELALGEVLQILNMAIGMRKWIVHHHSGWQPITITLAETKSENTTETDA